MGKVPENSSVAGKLISSTCSMSTDVKVEWLGGSKAHVSNGECKSAPDLTTRCSPLQSELAALSQRAVRYVILSRKP